MLRLPNILLPPLKHFGIAFGRAAIHAVELDSSGNVVKKSQIILAKEIFVEGVTTDPYPVVMAIKQLVSEGKFSSRYATVCFPEAFTFMRGYTLPEIPLEEVYEAISWHAKNVFPYPLKDIYYDWKLISKKGNEYNIAIVAIQKKILDGIIGTLMSAGIFPLRLEPDASATARLLGLNPTDHAVLIELNRTGAYVTLVEGEKAVFTTVVLYHEDEGVEIYARQIISTQKEILNYYLQKGVLTTSEIGVVFTGEMATLEWTKYLSETGEFQARILEAKVDDPAFHKAYAAALLAPVSPSDEQTINLLPAALQNKFEKERLQKYLEVILIRMGIILGIFCAISLALFVAIQMEKQFLEQRVKDLSELVSTQEGSTQRLLRLNAQAKAVTALSPLRKTPKGKLAILAELFGDTITVSEWQYDDQKLRYVLVGIAKTREDLIAFKNKVDEREEFGSVNLPLESLISATNVNFTMTFVGK